MNPEDTAAAAKPAVAQKVVTFRSDIKSYTIPMRNKQVRIEQGHQIPVDAGHVIQFSNGFYAADNTKPVQMVGRPSMTEAEFLEELVELREKRGDNYPVYKVVVKEDIPMSAADDGLGAFDVFNSMSCPEMRTIFTPQEIDKYKLATASQDKLVVTALMLRKDAPKEFAERLLGAEAEAE